MATFVTSPLALYGAALQRHLAGEPEVAVVRFADGSSRALEVPRFTGAADAVDERVLAELAGPVLDIGCGPGRHLGVLTRRGVFALGVDLSPAAIALARGRGGRAVLGSIFDTVPAEGRWRSALLLDGNIGIGGSPNRLLARARELVVTGGEVLVECDAPGSGAAARRARIELAGDASRWFEWAHVPADAIAACGAEVGLTGVRVWCDDDRWFARLRVA